MPQRSWKRGAIQGINKTRSYAFSCCILGLIYGAACATYDISPALAFICCVVVFSGAVQYATLSMLENDPPVSALLLTSVFVSLRLLLMGISLAPALSPRINWRTAIAIPVISDGNWAAMFGERDNPDRFAFFVASGFWMLACWAAGAYAGAYAASHISIGGESALVFAGTIFLVLLAMTVAKAGGGAAWRERIGWIVSTACAAAASLVLPFTVSATVGLVIGALVCFAGSDAHQAAQASRGRDD